VASRETARRTTYRTRRIRIRWIRVAGLLVVIAAIAAALGDQWPASSDSTASSSPTAAPPVAVPPSEPRDAPGEADTPDPANLDPALSDAMRQAAADAATEGVELSVTSGWRSPEHQQRLLNEAISRYGSEVEAARWVATPETSTHVSGDAVDIGPSAATAWLSDNGAQYGLCQIYGNEPWHYELRPEAVGDGCPAMYPDPTHDPRMQR
jgi:zinc D-Ala-D-Ala carboxypeptidase